MSKDTPTQEMFEAFQKMINPMAFPMQNLLMGGMKLEDIERKISELQTVHHWLSTNLGMLDLSIKTLEYQRALLQPTSSATGAGKETPVENPFLNPALWPWPYGQAGAPDAAAGTRPAGGAAGGTADAAARPGAGTSTRKPR